MMERIKIVLFMIIIAAVFGGGVTGIYLATKDTVEQNKVFVSKKALVELFDLGDANSLSKDEIINLAAKRIDDSEEITDPQTGAVMNLLKAYEDNAQTQLKAYGFKFDGIGFWAVIEGYIAVSPDLSKTTGLKVIQQSETPGLGGRIEEPFFIQPFADGITITAPTDGGPYIYMGSADNKATTGPRVGREFDAITGATQTSMAMDRMLNEDIAAFSRAMAAAQLETGE